MPIDISITLLPETFVSLGYIALAGCAIIAGAYALISLIEGRYGIVKENKEKKVK